MQLFGIVTELLQLTPILLIRTSGEEKLTCKYCLYSIMLVHY